MRGVWEWLVEEVKEPTEQLGIGNPAGAARAWLHRGTEHRDRVPVWRGEDRSVPRACERVSASQKRYHRGSRRDPFDQGGQECHQDDSHSYGGRWERPCRSRPN